MARYVGQNDNPGHVVAAGEQVKRQFIPSQHQAVSKEVKAFLAKWSQFAKAAKTADAAAAKDELARAALAEADAARDEALRLLDRKLIDAGEPKTNSFKRYGFPAPSAIARLAHAEETKLVAKLVKAVSAKGSAGVVAAAKALAKANDAVIEAELRAKAAGQVASKARAERDVFDRPTRAALSVLKLQVKLAEKVGLVGAYAQFFATDAPVKKKALEVPAPAPN